MAGNIFKFKQFEVDQSGCAMKVNTDAVLLGAIAMANNPQSIVDIGTGTGVIALMLAQRFANAHIDAIEIDEHAAETAGRNFKVSAFAGRLNVIHSDFAQVDYSGKHNLIVSNPPFFLDSLTSANEKKNLARHTDGLFFERFLKYVTEHLTNIGTCELILPLPTSSVVKTLLPKYQLYLQKVISVKSFTDSEPHREIITFGKQQKNIGEEDFVIYDALKVYSKKYQVALADFLTIF